MDEIEAGRDPLQQTFLNQIADHASGIMAEALAQFTSRDSMLALAFPCGEERNLQAGQLRRVVAHPTILHSPIWSACICVDQSTTG